VGSLIDRLAVSATSAPSVIFASENATSPVFGTGEALNGLKRLLFNVVTALAAVNSTSFTTWKGRPRGSAPTIIHYSLFIIHYSLLLSAPSVTPLWRRATSPASGGGFKWIETFVF